MKGFVLKCKNTVKNLSNNIDLDRGSIHRVLFVDNEKPIIIVTIQDINSNTILTTSIDFIFDNFEIYYS